MVSVSVFLAHLLTYIVFSKKDCRLLFDGIHFFFKFCSVTFRDLAEKVCILFLFHTKRSISESFICI